SLFPGGRKGGGIRMGHPGLVSPCAPVGNPAGGKTSKPLPMGCGPPAAPGCLGTRLLPEVSKQPESVYRCMVERGQLARRQPPIPEGPPVEVEALLKPAKEAGASLFRPPLGIYCLPNRSRYPRRRLRSIR